MTAAADADDAAVIAATQRWVEAAVIGLNLCPFARPIARAGRIRYVVSQATTRTALRQDLAKALQELVAAPVEGVETTLLLHPRVLQEFHAFNDFLPEADAVLEDLGLAGTIQIASFHPDYQFADSAPDDVANATNRSPFPTLHLLRESSIERAVQSMADPALIYQNNMATLRHLGHDGWRRLRQQFDPAAAATPASDRERQDASKRAGGTHNSESV